VQSDGAELTAIGNSSSTSLWEISVASEHIAALCD
jgi:hypothetical protein